MRSEEDFIGAIDCRFPYTDRAAARSLIEEACAISGNAAFMVAYELVRPSSSCGVDDATRLALLDQLAEHLTHPLKGSVVAVARRMVRGESLPVEECCSLLERVADHPGEFNALAVVCSSCEDAGTMAAERVYGRVVAAWLRSNTG